MKIKLIEHTMIDGQPVDAGTMIDVDDLLGRTLIYNRRADPVEPIVDSGVMTTEVDRAIVKPTEAATAPAQKKKGKRG
jgi:hypothetical protein